jgi:hypothetical protein
MYEYLFRVAGSEWKQYFEDPPMNLDYLVAFMDHENIDLITFDTDQGKLELRRSGVGDE